MEQLKTFASAIQERSRVHKKKICLPFINPGFLFVRGNCEARDLRLRDRIAVSNFVKYAGKDDACIKRICLPLTNPRFLFSLGSCEAHDLRLRARLRIMRYRLLVSLAAASRIVAPHARQSKLSAPEVIKRQWSRSVPGHKPPMQTPTLTRTELIWRSLQTNSFPHLIPHSDNQFWKFEHLSVVFDWQKKRGVFSRSLWKKHTRGTFVIRKKLFANAKRHTMAQ